MSKYEEALERARKYYKETTNDVYNYKDMLEQIFPDIEESEDKKIKEEIVNYFRCQSRDEPCRKHIHDKWIAWLEKQGEQKQHDIDILEKHITKDSISELAHTVIVRNGWEIVDAKEQNPAWSEEDENYLNTTIAYLKDANEFKKTAEKCITWLKSLRPQNTWKPSDEQMKQLGWIAEQNKDNMIGKSLVTLYNDLAKLREG